MRIIHAKTDSMGRRRVIAAENVFADEPGFDAPPEDGEDTILDDEIEDMGED